jgi:hypothetical protein
LTTVVEDPYRPLYTEAFVVALLVYLSIPQSVKSSGLGFVFLGRCTCHPLYVSVVGMGAV